jgi:hypothetical protein
VNDNEPDVARLSDLRELFLEARDDLVEALANIPDDPVERILAYLAAKGSFYVGDKKYLVSDRDKVMTMYWNKENRL